MIRGCAKKATCSLYSTSIVRGLAGFKCVNRSEKKDGHRNFGSSSQQSSNSTIWPSLSLGLAFGAAGFAYWMSSEENIAHCGKVDNWTYKPKTPKTQKSSSDITTSKETQKEESAAPVAEPVAPIPSHVPYLIVGAGTAGMAAYRAIRTTHANAKVLLIGEEEYKPYMRPPLSKDMWFSERSLADKNMFKTWSGRDRSIFFEKDSYYCEPSELSQSEKGGVAVLTGHKVVKLCAEKKQATLSDGTVITYDRCLIATGGRPRNLPALQLPEIKDKVTLFRDINDFKRLSTVTDKVQSVVVIGGGFLGSELACALGKRSESNGMKVTQVYPEQGNMGRVLPAYLSRWTTDKVRSENVTVIPEVVVVKSQLSEDGKQVDLLLNNGEELSADHVVVAVGLQPNTELAESAGLETDERFGGFLVNAELEAATDIWVAGDAACFYDVKLGRRRVEHHDHAVVSGRLAGENMAGASKRFLHQSMFWSDLGPDVGYEAIGLVDSELPTVAVFAKASAKDTPASAESRTGESLRSETEQHEAPSGESSDESANAEKYGKGVVFYMKGKRVVGVLCWNVFNKIGIARKIIKDGAEHEDLAELGKMFDLHEFPVEEGSEEAAAASN